MMIIEMIVLFQAWKEDKRRKQLRHRVVHNTGQLRDVRPEHTDYLLGKFLFMFL
jgi:hypothetical protein